MEPSFYNIFVVYQVGSGYNAEALQHIALSLSAYSKEDAIQQAKTILALNPEITRYTFALLNTHGVEQVVQE